MEQGIVFVSDVQVKSPAEKFDINSKIFVGSELVKPKISGPKLWIYHKPVGLITTHYDPEGRPTVFDNLPMRTKQKIISIGRLDINSEGLLLLTDDGMLSREFELPSSNIARTYKVRTYGIYNDDMLGKIEAGMLIDGIKYRPSAVKLLTQNITEKRQNYWFEITLTEGKNREIRNIFTALDMKINRLIRISYGPYQLSNLKPGEMRQVKI